MNAQKNNRWMILCVVVLMSFMSCLDSSIVNIALPVMRETLKTSMASIEWVVTGYVLMICATILVFGRLGDLRGKTRVFQWGVIVFTIGSLACGLSRNLSELIVFRLIQGIGAAAYMANNQGIITQTFQPGERGRALGILASGVALGTMMGPALGGLIISLLDWRAIFFVNVPLGFFSFLAGLRVLPQEERRTENFDLAGAALFFLFITTLIGGLTLAQTNGFKNIWIIVCIAASVPSLIAFVSRERSVKKPILRLALFGNWMFSLGLGCAFISFVCINASIILLPFYLQNAHGLSPATAGLIMMLSPLIVMILSPVSGFLSDKTGPEAPSFAGLLLMGGGFILMGLLKEETPIAIALVFFGVMAAGQGFFQPANNTLIMSAVPRETLGIAGSINSLTRNLGQVFGITLSTTLLYELMTLKAGHSVTDYISGRSDIFVFAMQRIYVALAAICLLGAVLSFLRLCGLKHDEAR